MFLDGSTLPEYWQTWPGYYAGNGAYVIRYIPKQAETLHYRFTSSVAGFTAGEGVLVVSNKWPGKKQPTDYTVGPNWYTDKAAADLYDGKIQGGKTIAKWSAAALTDWAQRWKWLR